MLNENDVSTNESSTESNSAGNLSLADYANQNSERGNQEGKATSQENNQEANQEMDQWFIGPELKGTGDKPEWFNSKQYGNIFEQAKSAHKMRQMVGAHSGAPEEYSLDLGKDYEGKQIDPEAPLLKSFMEFAKETKMSQEGFTGGIKMFLHNTEAAQKQEAEELAKFQELELAQLGDDAPQKIEEISQWFKQNFPDLPDKDFKDMMYFAGAYNVFSAMREKMRYSKVPSDNTAPFDPTPAHELRSLLTDSRYLSDPSFQKMVDNKYKQKYGV